MKRTISKIMVIIMIVMLLPLNIHAEETIKVRVNGELVKFDVQPTTIDNRTLVPVRAIFEKLGLEVGWKEETQTVIGSKEGLDIRLTIGSKTVTKNGETIELDVPAMTINNRTLVPVRFIAESTGAKVEWKESTKTVVITTDEPKVIEVDNKEYTSEELIKKLSTEFNGRQSGTESYKEAAEFVNGEFAKAGLSPLYSKYNYLQEYETVMATINSESISINGNKLELMKDYMPFSRMTSGIVSTEKCVFLGEGLEEDYGDIDVDGKTVIFLHKSIDGRVEPTLGRVWTAKKYGAKSVLIVANGFMKVGQYELPVNGRDAEISTLYISEELAEKEFGITEESTVKEIKANLSINMSITREDTTSYNVLGVLEGKRKDKALLLIANLDGFGVLPDGRVFETAQYGAVNTTMLIDMARYYKQHTPEYSIIFAAVGGKYTDRDGIKVLLNDINMRHIISTYEIYQLAGEEGLFTLSPNEYYLDILGKDRPDENSYGAIPLSHDIKDYTENLIFIRNGRSDIDEQLLNDTYNNVSISAYESNMKDIMNIVNKDFVKRAKEEDAEFNYSTEYETVYNEKAKREYFSLDTKYLNILFDDEYAQEITKVDTLKKFDDVYEFVRKNNYYAIPDEKITVIISSDLDSSVEIMEAYHLRGVFTGGLSSKLYDIIAMRVYDYGTFAHELNHRLVDYKKEYNDITNRFNQRLEEMHGRVYFNLPDTDTESIGIIDASNIITYNEEAKYVVEEYENGSFDWDWVYRETNPYGFGANDDSIASMLNFLYYNFGANTLNRAMYRIYVTEDIEGSLVADLGITIDEFMKEWCEWVTTFGEDGFSLDGYVDEMNWYDYTKIFTIQSIQNEEVKVQKNTTKFVCVKFTELPVIASNQKNFFAYEDDENEYVDINYVNLADTKDLNTIQAATDGENVYIKINYIKSNSNNIAVFLAGDTPGLKEFSKSLEKGEQTIILKFNRDELASYEVELIISLNGGFIMIDNKMFK